MKREIVLERVYDETRLAVLEDDRLCMYLSGRESAAGLSGNIYAGRVRNILPGMNAAFVDIGIGKNAYLSAQDSGAKRIGEKLRPGDMILCQVDKEPGGNKGPRVSTEITLTGRRAVLLPASPYAGVSKKIESEAERTRLHGIAKALSNEFGRGVILRTASEGCALEDIREEYAALIDEWLMIEGRGLHSSVPALIHADDDLALYAVRELLREDVALMRTDDEALYDRLRAHAGALTPALMDRVALHHCETPLFDLLRVDARLEEALSRRVDLKSGGTLVIDECEALTVIDVNTARFTGRDSLEETIFALNIEAAREVARQIRLRDLGGIIIVDFIDMADPEHRTALLRELEAQLGRDPNRTKLHGMTQLGLVEISRKKVRRPLSKRLTRDCPVCSGQGRIPRDETLAMQAARELYRRRRRGDVSPYRLITNGRIAEQLPPALTAEDTRVSVEIDPSENRYRIVPRAGQRNEADTL